MKMLLSSELICSWDWWERYWNTAGSASSACKVYTQRAQKQLLNKTKGWKRNYLDEAFYVCLSSIKVLQRGVFTGGEGWHQRALQSSEAKHNLNLWLEAEAGQIKLKNNTCFY